MQSYRYFLDRDQSSHWYLIPVANKDEWDEWSQLPEEDERSWEAPEFAKRLPGPPSFLEFKDPRYDGRKL